jgi:undecaprenyl diphosphate synthase
MVATLTQGPHHVAMVMDGNGRWASQRFLPRIAGHRQGVESLKRMVRACALRQVHILTVFAFSSENWSRPADEVSGLMDLLAGALAKEVAQLHKEGVQLRFVGDRASLSERVRQGLITAEATTVNNSGLILNVCFNYGGRWDVAQAARSVAERGEPVTEAALSAAMALAPCPDPDLLIRTGGEYRLSNFLLWQAAYAELFFSPLLWPDFDEQALEQAFSEFRLRERRYGKTSAQLVSGN